MNEASRIDTTPELVRATYEAMTARLEIVRQRLGRPVTLAEKILFGHLDDPKGQELEAGSSFLMLRPDRVAMQDATAQMALLQFMHAGKKQTAVPSTVHCDHLIRAHVGADKDTGTAISENHEVYDFLASVSNKYGIGFWKPGSGIIHQVVLENYAFPGGMMIGTDSHTPNAGGLGMIAVGVGGADAVDVMAGFPWEVKYPKLTGVKLSGKLNGWTSPKDVILKLLGIMSCAGGTNRIVEYFGPGVASISCTGKATITNMGAELGATTSVFPFDDRMGTYLRATNRAELAALAEEYRTALLSADTEVEADPAKYYDQVIEIDLSTLEPHVVGPHTPDLARPISQLKKDVAERGYPDALSAVLIGSCTNSSYEDIGRAADVARQAQANGINVTVPLMVSPGSEQIFETIRRDGQMQQFEQIGGTVLANACGPCIGQWKREGIPQGQPNSILTSFNRNFPARNDGNSGTMAFISSPEIVLALGIAGSLSFNPITDTIKTADGREVMLQPPTAIDELPTKGFIRARSGFLEPASDPDQVEVRIDPASKRLQALDRFKPFPGRDYQGLPVLLKARGKCTTDHISPAGPWLRFRGHLDNISDNMFLGAVNAFSAETGRGLNQISGERNTYTANARAYKAGGLNWVVVGDFNYGEGSSREHAAMSPRHLGGVAIIVRSFARIHETNLKKQGMLPLTFQDPADYDRVQENDRVDLHGLTALTPGSTVTAVFHHADGTVDEAPLKHTMTEEQIAWFIAGSALNLLSLQASGHQA